MNLSAPIRFECEDLMSRKYLSDTLKAYLKEPFVALCIGSDKSISDSLGPFCGMFLRKYSNIPVHGTLEKPVHRANLAFTMDVIRLLHPKHTVLAVDAAFGIRDLSGSIMFIEDGVIPASEFESVDYKAGDIAVIGVTDYPGSDRDWLNKVRISTVYDMAQMIAMSIIDAGT